MSSDTSQTDSEYSAIELKQLSAREARDLPEHEYERWAALQDLQQDLSEKKRKAAEAEQTAINLAVGADMSELHETIDAYGNEITFHLDATDTLRETVQDADVALNADSLEAADLSELQEASEIAVSLFAETWVSFEDPDGNVEDVASYPEADRKAFARRCIDQWGIRPSFLLLARMMTQIRQHDREVTDAVQSFPGEEGARADDTTGVQQSWQRR